MWADLVEWAKARWATVQHSLFSFVSRPVSFLSVRISFADLVVTRNIL
jgi:hypothetical protein